MKKYYIYCLLFLLVAGSTQAQEFVNEVTIPPLIVDDNYHLNVIETEHNFNPNGTGALNSMIRTFAFEDANNPGTTSILGPSIAWRYLHDLNPKVTNMLDEVTTCHWHGAHVPQYADGGPHQRIQPDSTWDIEFPVLDKSATMWYHPHAMGLTYEHVQMGLSGMLYVEDPTDGLDDPISSFLHDILPNAYNENDFPLIFQTKKFIPDTINGGMQIMAERGFKDGYEYMVNGIIDPYLEVPANMVRLRLLNGDGKFSFNFTFESEDGSAFPAQMIATDAGYMDRTHQLNEVIMSPGERTEWLLDLRGLEGEDIYIKNVVSNLPDGIIGNSATTNGYAVDRRLLKIKVGPPANFASPIIAFPINLQPLETPSMDLVTRERTKVFRRDSFLIGNNKKFLFNIDSMLMDMMVVNDVVKLDSTEIWTIENTTDIGHPWHIHDIHFWVTEVIDADGNMLNPNDYPEIFNGPKDNVLVRPGWKLSYIATFDDYGTEIEFFNSYMFHCHILPHEDQGMMGQFVVWNGEGNPPSSVSEDPRVSTIPMTVYPNPARNFVFLEGSSAEASTLRFIDMQGRVVQQVRIPAFDGMVQINTEQLPTGIFVMDWQTKEGRAVTRVVLQE